MRNSLHKGNKFMGTGCIRKKNINNKKTKNPQSHTPPSQVLSQQNNQQQTYSISYFHAKFLLHCAIFTSIQNILHSKTISGQPKKYRIQAQPLLSLTVCVPCVANHQESETETSLSSMIQYYKQFHSIHA